MPYDPELDRPSYATPRGTMLAGNADRDATVDHLSQMAAEGYLTPEDFTARRDKALTARTKDDLSAIVCDLPDDKQTAKRYKLQVAGNAVPFSWLRWSSVLALALACLILPGPLMAAAFGGFDHAPGQGSLPAMIIFAGAVIMLVGGTAFAPSGETEPERNRRKKMERW